MNHDRPRLLLVNRDLSVGGGITYMDHLSRGLIALGWDVFYQSIPGPMAARMRASGVKIQYKGWGHALQLPFIVRMLRHLKPDVVNSHSNSTTAAVAKACTITGTKFVVTAHNPLVGDRMTQMRSSFLSADAIVVMNDTLANHFHRDLPLTRERIFASRLFIPWSESPIAARETTELAYCSRLSGSKGPMAESFLRAGLSLGLPVTVIGTGRQKRRLQKIGGKFVGHSDDVPAFFRKATVAGGAGFVAIEALEAGAVPVGLGFRGCQGAVTPEKIEWAAARNYGDTDPVSYEHSVERVKSEIERALEVVRSGQVAELRDRARAIHSMEVVIPVLNQFYRRIANGEPFSDISRRVDDF